MSGHAEHHKWVIDSIEEFVASIEVDGAKMIQLPLWVLPDGAHEGHVLAVNHERPKGGTRSVLTVEIDETGTKDALEKSAAQVAKSRAQPHDPGGDIAL